MAFLHLKHSISVKKMSFIAKEKKDSFEDYARVVVGVVYQDEPGRIPQGFSAYTAKGSMELEYFINFPAPKWYITHPNKRARDSY